MREAIVSLSSEELRAIGLGDLMERFSEAGLVKLQEVECRANGGVVQIETPITCTGGKDRGAGGG